MLEPRPGSAVRRSFLNGVLAFGPALLVLVQGLLVGPRFDRFVLPAFDGFVYVAMAESPRVFTLAPWGYRILSPWIVHSLPFSSAAAGFFWLNLVLLSGAVFLIGWWLRRLGFSPLAAALGGQTLAVTPPLGALLDYQVLVDPLALLITVLVLNELVTPHGLTLAALFAVGAITKEACLIPLVVLPFVLATRIGWKRATLQSAIIAAPAIFLLILLRVTWGQGAPPTRFLLTSILERAGEAPLAFVAAFAGVTLVGFIGFFRERSRDLRVAGSLLWFGNFLAVLANPYGFSPPDLLRISLFAWSALLPLALVGVGFPRLAVSQGVGPAALRRVISVGALLAALGLVLGTDSYRRAPPEGSPDPVAFLARSRETLKTARALDEGDTFSFDVASGRFAAPVTERFNLTEGRQQRWFLYSGFGSDAAFGSGEPEVREKAELLLPILVPRTATMSAEFDGPVGAQVTVNIAGLDMGAVPANGSRTPLLLPGAALIRGDNIVRLGGPAGVPIKLLRFEVRLEPD